MQGNDTPRTQIGLRWLARRRCAPMARDVELDPTAEGYAALARALAAAGSPKDASEVAALGFALFPKSTDLRLLYASARVFHLEHRRRRAAGRKAVRHTAELIDLHLAFGDLRAATALMEEAAGSGPPDPRLALAFARIRLARFRTSREPTDGLEALRWLEQAASDLRTGVAATRLLAEFAAEVGAWRAAQLYFTRWSAVSPSDPRAMRLASEIHRHFREVSPDLPTAIRLAGRVADGSGETEAPDVANAVRHRLRALVESGAALRAAHPAFGVCEGVEGPDAENFLATTDRVADTGRRSIVRIGLGEPLSLSAGGPHGGIAVGFGVSGCASADCPDFETAKQAEGMLAHVAGLPAAGGGEP
jgi:hypothetical protein